VGRDAAGPGSEDRPAEAGLPRIADPRLRADGEEEIRRLLVSGAFRADPATSR